jgi:hypothetical protein
MRSRRPAVACNDVFHQADGSTERRQSLRQAYGESDPAEDVSHILTGLRSAAPVRPFLMRTHLKRRACQIDC